MLIFIRLNAVATKLVLGKINLLLYLKLTLKINTVDCRKMIVLEEQNKFNKTSNYIRCDLNLF